MGRGPKQTESVTQSLKPGANALPRPEGLGVFPTEASRESPGNTQEPLQTLALQRKHIYLTAVLT